ncbi:exported protein (hyp9) [Plasmodium reichenowi]|uniref:Exported protein (Hyp9) n=1 Tax=Plasmodium reichenowi TaxID=5854 RepID=A0A151LVC0_PLARE|nr:exported protein (hyp9) [Plasmodium reichenowi]KYO03130.1 exported protein (hyp9) [Plasmodium reichenowi]
MINKEKISANNHEIAKSYLYVYTDKSMYNENVQNLIKYKKGKWKKVFKFLNLFVFIFLFVYIGDYLGNELSYQKNDVESFTEFRINRLLVERKNGKDKDNKKTHFNRLEVDFSNNMNREDYMEVDSECRVLDVNSMNTSDGKYEVKVTMQTALTPRDINIYVLNNSMNRKEWDKIIKDIYKDDNGNEISEGKKKIKKKKLIKYVVDVLGYAVLIVLLIPCSPFILFGGIGRCTFNSKESGKDYFKAVWNALF